MRREIGYTRVLVIANKYFDEDPRAQREVGALLESGYEVEVICPRKRLKKDTLFTDNSAVSFYPLIMGRKRSNKARYVFEYGVYFLYTFFMSTWLYMRHRHKVIQVFVMPEFLVLSCIIPKLMGAKILMDWMDPMREVFLAKFPDKSTSRFLTAIKCFEKLSVLLANHIITPNEGFRRTFVARGIRSDKITIVMNVADTGIFKANHVEYKEAPSKKPFTLFYSGTIVEHNGLDIAIKALRKVVDRISDIRLLIVGDGAYKYTNECRALTKKLGLLEYIEWRGRIPTQEMPKAIYESSAGIIPNRINEFTMINFPTRIMELAILRKPIIASRLPGIEDYLDDRSICFFKPENHEDLARCILDIYSHPEKVCDLTQNAYHWCQSMSWPKTKKVYLKVFEDLRGHTRK